MSLTAFIESDNNLTRIFDVTRLGLATYFLALIYTLLAILATFKHMRMYEFMSAWSSQKLFHVFVTVHLYVRSFSFGLLCIFSIIDTQVWYPLLVFLFTLPEFFVLSTYSLLCFQVLEIYVFSHDQFLIPSIQHFRYKWRVALFVISFLLYLVLCTLYLLLILRPSEFSETLVSIICYTTAIGCIALPAAAVLAAIWFGFFVLSGFPFASAMARDRVKKVNNVVLVWSFGRIVRGIVLIISINQSWQATLDSLYLSMVVVSVLAIAEILPFILVLDWSVIGALLLDHGSDATSMAARVSYDGDYVVLPQDEDASDQKYILDRRQIHLIRNGMIDDTGISYTQKGTYNNHPVAIHAFRLDSMSDAMVEELQTDVIELSNVKHPHIVPFVGVAREGNVLYQVTEFMQRGSLQDVLNQATQDFAPFTILRLARDIALGMQHLHARGQVHGHLKSRNILLDGDMVAYVGDIGLRRLKAYTEVMLVQRMATAWASPEVLRGEPASRASDVYSYGIICWQLVTRQIPFDNLTLPSIYDEVVKKQNRPSLPTDKSIQPEFLQLITQCWSAKPETRPTFESIITSLDTWIGQS